MVERRKFPGPGKLSARPAIISWSRTPTGSRSPTSISASAQLLLKSVLLLPTCFLYLLSADPAHSDERSGVKAIVETVPVRSSGDAADDPALWVNPKNPDLSFVIGTDKETPGLAVYDLQGREIQFLQMPSVNNVDLRDDFPLSNKRKILVVASNPNDKEIALLLLDPRSGRLKPIMAHNNRSEVEVHGICMFRSPKTGRYFGFNIGKNGKSTQVEQWEIVALGNSLTLELRRSWKLRSRAEACVADDAMGFLFVAEQTVGIWRFPAEPEEPLEGVLVASTEEAGNLQADVEGLAIYNAGKENYLIASSRGSDPFAIYNIGDSKFLGNFLIGDGSIDGVSHTDGIEVSGRFLGARFPNGILIAHDDANDDSGNSQHQNFKLVPWEKIARAFRPNLRINTDLGREP